MLCILACIAYLSPYADMAKVCAAENIVAWTRAGKVLDNSA